MILAAALFVTACSRNSYTVIGSIPQWCGDEVVNVRGFNSPIVIETIPVSDHQFKYEGEIDSLPVLVFSPPDESVEWVTIIEPGTIHLNAYTGYASGTPLNDAIVEYDKDAISLQYSMPVDEYLEAIREKSNAFINAHINDVAGAYVLMSSLSCHSDEEVQDFIDRSGPAFYTSPLIKELQRKYPRLKKAGEN